VPYLLKVILSELKISDCRFHLLFISEEYESFLEKKRKGGKEGKQRRYDTKKGRE
jgi:hypothetical protein